MTHSSARMARDAVFLFMVISVFFRAEALSFGSFTARVNSCPDTCLARRHVLRDALVAVNTILAHAMQQRSRSLTRSVSPKARPRSSGWHVEEETAIELRFSVLHKVVLVSAETRSQSAWQSQRVNRRTGTQCDTPATFLLHDGKRIECAIAVDAERSRKLRCGTPFI